MTINAKSIKFALAVAIVSIASLFASVEDPATMAKMLKETAETGDGISEKEQAVVEKIQSKGAEVIPYLLPLLKDKNEDVRDLAGYTLRDIKGLAPKELPDLMEACRKGNGWIPPAIAQIGTPQAVSFLVGQFIEKPETDSQLVYAIALLGEKAVPNLIEFYRSEKEWNDTLEMAMDSLWGAVRPDAHGAVEPLMQIARNASLPVKARERALHAIVCIGPFARSAIPGLQKLQADPEANIRWLAETAIVETESAESAPLLARRLAAAAPEQSADNILISIANLETRGISAGPEVLKFLDQGDWGLRNEAIHVLGHIGYRPSVERLISALDDEKDWRVVFRAAEALGRLDAQSADEKLRQVAKTHWYKPVRQIAERALRRDFKSGEFLNLYHEASGEMLLDEDIERLHFAVKPFAPPLRLTVRERGKPAKEKLYRGIQVKNGWLVGTDRGEWGGEIEFIDPSGIAHIIQNENTEAIYRMEEKIVAVTGLAHLGFNYGGIYLLESDSAGLWTAKLWRVLPGAPRFSVPLKDGRILINCYAKGIVLISPSGEMQSISRDEAITNP